MNRTLLAGFQVEIIEHETIGGFHEEIIEQDTVGSSSSSSSSRLMLSGVKNIKKTKQKKTNKNRTLLAGFQDEII